MNTYKKFYFLIAVFILVLGTLSYSVSALALNLNDDGVDYISSSTEEFSPSPSYLDWPRASSPSFGRISAGSSGGLSVSELRYFPASQTADSPPQNGNSQLSQPLTSGLTNFNSETATSSTSVSSWFNSGIFDQFSGNYSSTQDLSLTQNSFGQRLGQLIILERLFRNNSNGILGSTKSLLGNLFILDQLFR